MVYFSMFGFVKNLPVKHMIHLSTFAMHSYFFLKLTGFMDSTGTTSSTTTKTTPATTSFSLLDDEHSAGHYGLTITLFLYFLKLITCIGLPVSIANTLGILLFNMFPRTDRVSRRSAPLLDPFISFRVVTRGCFPDLVCANVERNLRTCEEFGMDKFVIEVVTDRPLTSNNNNNNNNNNNDVRCGGLPRSGKVRQIVVPDVYRTQTGAKFKARALQYALEPYVDILSDDDWIVHLDEETIVTHSALVGILNFVHEKKHQIGQGLITYGKEEVVNWMTTLADSIRVASDMGSMRFSLKTLHKPLYSFKGSFIVCQAHAERAISFEHGAEGSIAEDAYFAVKAASLGYSFDWIEGEMLEKSPFSFWDFVKQRKRWIQGLYLLVHDRHLKSSLSKYGFTYSFYTWILLPVQLVISALLMLVFPQPVSFTALDEFFTRFNGFVFIYMFMLGAVKSLNLGRKRPLHALLCLVGVFVSIPFLLVSETVAIFWGLLTRKTEFFIVKKNDPIIHHDV